MPLIEDQFLKNDKSEYVDTYSAIVALRVLGQETNVIPKDRLVGSLRHMLDRPQLADLVIPDLARWQDWGSMDKLVDLFKNANEESSWVRVPVVQFLRACPEPKAKEYIDELAKIDPDAVKRATNYLALPGAGGPAVATTVAPAAAKIDEPAAAADASTSTGTPAAPTATTDAPKTETPTPEVAPGGIAAEIEKDATAEPAAATEATAKKVRPELDEPFDPTRNYEKVADTPHDGVRADGAQIDRRGIDAQRLGLGHDCGGIGRHRGRIGVVVPSLDLIELRVHRGVCVVGV